MGESQKVARQIRETGDPQQRTELSLALGDNLIPTDGATYKLRNKTM
jgi:hypothetical protein